MLWLIGEKPDPLLSYEGLPTDAPWFLKPIGHMKNDQGGEGAVQAVQGKFLYIYKNDVIVYSIEVTNTTYVSPQEGLIRLNLDSLDIDQGHTYTYALDEGAFFDPNNETDTSPEIKFGDAPNWKLDDSIYYEGMFVKFNNSFNYYQSAVAVPLEDLEYISIEINNVIDHISGSIYIRDENGTLLESISSDDGSKFQWVSNGSLYGHKLIINPNITWDYSTRYFITTDVDFFTSGDYGFNGIKYGINPRGGSTSFNSYWNFRTETGQPSEEKVWLYANADYYVVTGNGSTFSGLGGVVPQARLYEMGWDTVYQLREENTVIDPFVTGV